MLLRRAGGICLAVSGLCLAAHSSFAASTAGSLAFGGSTVYTVQNTHTKPVLVYRTGGSTGAASAVCSAVNGTAVQGTDFTLSGTTVSWAAGDTAPKQCGVAVIDAVPFTGSKTFTLKLTSASGATVGSLADTSVVIFGNKGGGTAALSASAVSVAQNAGSVTITVNRTGGSAGTAAIAYATANATATAGKDYTATSGELQWGNGDAAAKTITIPISTATAFSGTKTFAVAIASPETILLGSPASSIVTITGSSQTASTAATSTDACLVAAMPSTDTIFASSKKIFAHYMTTFPLSIDNAASANDYYNKNYLSPTGESNKFLAQGGFVRQRPLGVAVGGSNYKAVNYQKEVQMAIARGITGFTFDVMSAADVSSTSVLSMLETAAQAVDTRFKIVVMPDMTVLGDNADAVVDIVTTFAKSPAAYRLADGRLVVSPFDAGLETPAFWEGVLSRLTSAGINVAFVGTFLGWQGEAAAFNSFSYGFSDWGTPTVAGSAFYETAPSTVLKTYDKIFMMPVDAQQYRPKDAVYWEPNNSGAFRAAWTSAIAGNAAWVQNVTWNDFSESSEVEPYTDSSLDRTIGTGFYNLEAYYANWFLTGTQPAISHDVLYYFYRREPTSGTASKQTDLAALKEGVVANQIELLAFLTAPGELSITIDGKTYTEQAPAGLTSFVVPTAPGTPTFALIRNGSTVFSFAGGTQIYGTTGLPSGYQDLTYWSGSASSAGKCSL